MSTAFEHGHVAIIKVLLEAGAPTGYHAKVGLAISPGCHCCTVWLKHLHMGLFFSTVIQLSST